MLNETSGMPLAGGAMIAALAYAGLSLFVTGPLVGERMAIKSDWATQCPRSIRAGLEARIPAPVQLPKIGCDETLGLLFGGEGKAFCGKYGQDWVLPGAAIIEGIEAQKHRVARELVEKAAARSESRCACALSVALEENRTAFALHAGSLRLISPQPVKALGAHLASALSAPVCAMKG